jgi:hypothetical protein
MKRVGLGTLFFAWLYGVPFVLLVGLVRRTSKPYTPTHADAVAFGTTTDTWLWVGLVLNLVLPVAGLVAAGLVRDGFWLRHFGFAAAGLVVIYIVVAAVGSAGTGGLIGHVPADREPAPVITQCIPRSGGHGCPGG